MRTSEMFGRTLRQAPAGSETFSHSLLVRGGFIRQVSAGIFAWLPLGVRVLRRIESIVREEMDRAGAGEVLMPALMPKELLSATGRWDGFGPELYRLEDAAGRSFFLGPTHEELITSLARAELKSYRDLPRTVYQIQWKFRFAPRARGGLLRGREFLMKDAYSFDRDADGMQRSYMSMVEAYWRVFGRCGLDVRKVEADPGVMGGAMNHEFVLPSEVGETDFAECSGCGYAANLDVASARTLPRSRIGMEMRRVHTPGRVSADEVAEFLGVEPANIVKALLVEADNEVVCLLIPGDRQLSEAKLARILGAASIEMLGDPEFERRGIVKGFAGPVGLDIPLIADLSLERGSGLVTGANEADHHFQGVEVGRDFVPTRWEDLTVVSDADPCPRCAGSLFVRRGIELAHVFELGTKYSEAMEATFSASDGLRAPYLMGCYGIGISRIVAAIAEVHHDSRGIVWPKETAPAEVVIVLLDRSRQAGEAAARLYEELGEIGRSAVLDDRDSSAGVKFADADLIGYPVQVIFGREFVGSGRVEVRSRATGASKASETPLTGVVDALEASP